MKKLTLLLVVLLIVVGGWVMFDEPVINVIDESAEVSKVVAIRNITLKEGISPAEFERFVTEEFLPVSDTHFHIIKSTFLKGDRGLDVNGYLWLIEINSVHARDWYYTPGTAGGWQAAFEACAACQTTMSKLEGMIVENLYQDYTDYVELK